MRRHCVVVVVVVVTCLFQFFTTTQATHDRRDISMSTSASSPIITIYIGDERGSGGGEGEEEEEEEDVQGVGGSQAPGCGSTTNAEQVSAWLIFCLL